MCGIIGIIGQDPVAPAILDALKRLEYRGYDSAGIATLEGGHLECRRAPGKLKNLEARLAQQPLTGASASAIRAGPPTAGRPRTTPIRTPGSRGRRPQRHHREFSRTAPGTESQGPLFATDTDTEVVAHLVTECRTGSWTGRRRRGEPAPPQGSLCTRLSLRR